MRFFLDLPRLALREQLLQIGGLAFGRLRILFDHGAFEGWLGVVEQYAERHREQAERHLDEHVREPAVGLVVDDHASALPVAIDDIDDFEHQSLQIHRKALAAGVEH